MSKLSRRVDVLDRVIENMIDIDELGLLSEDRAAKKIVKQSMLIEELDRKIIDLRSDMCRILTRFHKDQRVIAALFNHLGLTVQYNEPFGGSYTVVEETTHVD